MWLRSTSTLLLLLTCLPAQNAPSKKAPAPAISTVPMLAGWSALPQLDGNIVKGSIIVSNPSDDDYDQTVVVEAVNEIGKAFTLGYQHFPLRHRSTSPLVPFATYLPPGHYLILADAIAEDSKRNSVLRIHLQAPAALVVTTI
jgi:hypothetical protein